MFTRTTYKSGASAEHSRSARVCHLSVVSLPHKQADTKQQTFECWGSLVVKINLALGLAFLFVNRPLWRRLLPPRFPQKQCVKNAQQKFGHALYFDAKYIYEIIHICTAVVDESEE